MIFSARVPADQHAVSKSALDCIARIDDGYRGISKVRDVAGCQRQPVPNRYCGDLSVQQREWPPSPVATAHQFPPDQRCRTIKSERSCSKSGWQLVQDPPRQPFAPASGLQPRHTAPKLGNGDRADVQLFKRSRGDPAQHIRIGPRIDELADDVRIEQKSRHCRRRRYSGFQSRENSSCSPNNGEFRKNSIRSRPVLTPSASSDLSIDRSALRAFSAVDPPPRNAAASFFKRSASPSGITNSRRRLPFALARWR